MQGTMFLFCVWHPTPSLFLPLFFVRPLVSSCFALLSAGPLPWPAALARSWSGCRFRFVFVEHKGTGQSYSCLSPGSRGGTFGALVAGRTTSGTILTYFVVVVLTLDLFRFPVYVGYEPAYSLRRAVVWLDILSFLLFS